MAAFYPAGLMVMTIYLGSQRPREAGLAFVIGALLAGLAMAVIVYFLLKSWHLDLPSRQHPRYGLRLGLGMVMIVASVLLGLRKRPNRTNRPDHPDHPAKPKLGGVLSRLLTDPAPVTALVVGFGLFFFSFAFIAAVQVIATAREGAVITVLAMIAVIVIYAGCAWLPYVFYLLSQERTTRVLRALNQWLAAHGRTIWLVVLALAGVIVAINGAVGLS